MTLFKEKASLTAFSLVLSLYTLAAFHVPFFSHAIKLVGGGFNGVVIIGTAALLLLCMDYLLYYLLVWCGRIIGRVLICLTLVGDAVMLFGVVAYDVLVTDEMMGNVLNTQSSEVAGFLSWQPFLYIFLLAVLPSIYVLGRKVEYGSWKHMLANVGVCIGLFVAAIFGNMKNWPWIDRNSTELGSLIMPWSYIINTFRFYASEREKNQKEIPLPDVTAMSDTRDVCVLIIGESARRDRFSLLGYERETNRFTVQDSVKAYPAIASNTYTRAGVKAILEAMDVPELYEILPNYLQRAGADVVWRTHNWGEPPVHTGKYFTFTDLARRYPEADDRYDGLLLEGLKEEIEASDSAKLLVVIHAYTNHGPSYNTNYPKEFEVFTPVCNTVEMSQTSPEELNNAYDNSIVYTDYLMHQVIEVLRGVKDRRAMMLFVSDHGESLGENNLYMHGVPLSMAPREQLEIPLVLWTSDTTLQYKDLPEVGQHHVFHTVLRFMGVESPAFNEELCIFAKN
jgi:lipid A ethanolaminephosphotransferase